MSALTQLVDKVGGGRGGWDTTRLTMITRRSLQFDDELPTRVKCRCVGRASLSRIAVPLLSQLGWRVDTQIFTSHLSGLAITLHIHHTGLSFFVFISYLFQIIMKETDDFHGYKMAQTSAI